MVGNQSWQSSFGHKSWHLLIYISYAQAIRNWRIQKRIMQPLLWHLNLSLSLHFIILWIGLELRSGPCWDRVQQLIDRDPCACIRHGPKVRVLHYISLNNRLHFFNADNLSMSMIKYTNGNTLDNRKYLFHFNCSWFVFMSDQVCPRW